MIKTDVNLWQKYIDAGELFVISFIFLMISLIAVGASFIYAGAVYAWIALTTASGLFICTSEFAVEQERTKKESIGGLFYETYIPEMVQSIIYKEHP